MYIVMLVAELVIIMGYEKFILYTYMYVVEI